jgi:2-succinyl-5-enolpyruvyl-6-hydroxy-3-cyclohexene-1-carboxylate synthase
VAPEVGGNRSVAFREHRRHLSPARAALGEAVKQEDGAPHSAIMTATDSYLLLRALCDELARCGLQHACTSPGSRSAPLVLSLVREPRIRCWSHIDERSSAFFAVGAAKASGRPVAVTCTSGTAAANFGPAVIEAFHAGVPLLVLTADRPPELRDVGAGQAIDQLKLYGDAVKWFVEVGVDVATPQRLRWIRALACRAYWTALGERPGPVHLNFPLREPLVLDGPLGADPLPGRPRQRPWLARITGHAAVTPPPASAPLSARGVVVAGAGEYGCEVAQFAERMGYPILADSLSAARRSPAAIARYDLLLRDPAFISAVTPELVIRSGDLPTSKPLRAWLASLPHTRQWALDGRARRQDPDAALTDFQDGDPAVALSTWEAPETPDPEWMARWRDADERTSAVIAELLRDQLSEPAAAAWLGDWLGPEAILFVASSMPVRDIELFFPAGVPLPRVLANRGANGIDGTVSSAFGAAAAEDRPVVLLIGDVALLHDIGGLLAARRHGRSLTIVLINNDGGGIFHFLPLAGETDAFEEHVATPHAMDFSRAADFYGCAYELAGGMSDLRASLERALDQRAGTTIIEVRTDRSENLALHRRIAAAVTLPVPAASLPA